MLPKFLRCSKARKAKFLFLLVLAKKSQCSACSRMLAKTIRHPYLVYSTPERLIMKSRDNVKIQSIVIRTKLRKPSSATSYFTHRHFTQRICRLLFILALLLHFIKHLSAWTEPLDKEQRTRYLFFSSHTHRFIRCACNRPFVFVTRLIHLVSTLSNPSAWGAVKGW